MLSLKASRADNFYYGTVEDEQAKEKKKKEEKKRNPKQFDEIKFETPFTIICKKCDKYIYKGVRFKSQRKRVGYYLNTPFYSFTLFCPDCSNQIIIETNPKDCSYDIIEGARKKNEEYKNVITEKGKNNVDGIDLEEIKKCRANPFLLLEKRALEKKKEEEKEQEKTNIIRKGIEETNYVENEENNHLLELKTKLSSNSEPEEEGQSSESEMYSSEGDLEEVIKKQYLRNKMLKDDFRCNRNLRNQLRNIKKEKIQEFLENKQKNIFIKLLQDPYENDKEKYKSLQNKYKRKIKMQTNYIKNKLLVKKSSIFDKKYVKSDQSKK